MKKIGKALLVAVVLVFVLLCIVANFMIDYSLKPESLERSRQTEKLIGEMRRDYPWTQSWLDSMQQHQLFRDTFVASRVDGSKLYAMYASARKPTPKTAILVHGYTDCIIRILPLAYMYNNDLDFNILVMEHHAHGQSEGEAIQMGWLDRLDVLNWMKIAHDIFSTPEAEAQLVVHGVSMGGATTMNVSGEVEGKGPAAQLDCVKDLLPMPYAKCFVDDCGYSSVWDEFAGELEVQFGLPTFPILNLASLFCDLRYGWNFKEASPENQVKRCSLPMLFIHGDQDTFVPTAMVYKVHDAKPEPKELWLTPGVPHAWSYAAYHEEYTQRVQAFTEKYMK